MHECCRNAFVSQWHWPGARKSDGGLSVVAAYVAFAFVGAIVLGVF